MSNMTHEKSPPRLLGELQMLLKNSISLYGCPKKWATHYTVYVKNIYTNSKNLSTPSKWLHTIVIYQSLETPKTETTFLLSCKSHPTIEKHDDTKWASNFLMLLLNSVPATQIYRWQLQSRVHSPTHVWFLFACWSLLHNYMWCKTTYTCTRYSLTMQALVMLGCRSSCSMGGSRRRESMPHTASNFSTPPAFNFNSSELSWMLVVYYHIVFWPSHDLDHDLDRSLT